MSVGIETQIIVAQAIYKLASLFAGSMFAYMGYRLFMVGVWGEAGDVEAQFQDNKLVIKRAAPGTFFALFGALVVCVTIFRGFQLEDRGRMYQKKVLLRLLMMKVINCLRIFLSSVLFLMVFGLSLDVTAAEREDLYALGKSAYESQDYVLAIKNLYAFYIVNLDSINENPSFKNSIESKISECETKLALALASNKSLDMRAGRFILRSDEIDGGFLGNARELEEFLDIKSIDIDRMLNSKKGIVPSAE